jgi:haloacetate dehalogenase
VHLHLLIVTFDAFSRELIPVSGGKVFARRAGGGPAVLLLHGFPETSLAWRKLAPLLATRFTVVAADLPGYGDSTLADSAIDNGRVSKGTMANILAEAMTGLGISRFAVVGHDRGARVAYRLALNHPERVSALTVLDVVPILDVAEGLTYEAARQMGHWFWLTQPSTVPERLIGCEPDLYVRDIIEQWGGSQAIEREAVDEYARCMRNPHVRRTMGAEYRADQLDLADDRADRLSGRRIACPLLAVWAQGGLVEVCGDPEAIWGRWAAEVEGHALPGGHFLMEESPQELAALVVPFLARALDGEFRSPGAPDSPH